MKYTEIKQDLFTVSHDYYLAHCISADFAMGKGIVVQFNKIFDMKNRLQTNYPHYIQKWKNLNKSFDCILEDRVFNLITKERYFHKPTYKSLTGALEIMKDICLIEKIDKIAMPMIGSGLDKLEWNKISRIICEIFNDTNIEILICKL